MSSFLFVFFVRLHGLMSAQRTKRQREITNADDYKNVTHDKYRVNGPGLQLLRHRTKQSRGVLPVITNNLEANIDWTDY